MIDDHFRIFVEQLREKPVEQVQEEYSPEFLDVQERDLSFKSPVSLSGQAYLAEEMLVLCFDIKTAAIIPCRICNEPVEVDIVIQGFYHAVPLEEIKSGIYDFKELLRETILIEAPILAECHEGNCPHRIGMEKFLKKDDGLGNNKSEEEGYKPFAGLDFKPQDE